MLNNTRKLWHALLCWLCHIDVSSCHLLKNLSRTVCHFDSFDYHNFRDYLLFLNETVSKSQVGVFLQGLPESSNVFALDINTPGCIWVSLREFNRSFYHPFEVDVSLFSSHTILLTKYEGCFGKGLSVNDDDLVWFCGFSFNILHEGQYNISIRSQYGQTPSENEIDWPQSQLGVYNGRPFQGWTIHRLYQIRTTKFNPNKPISAINQHHHRLPLCTFHHEKLLYEGLGDPRWVKVANFHQNHHSEVLRRIWFEDSYEWVNDLCRHIPLTKEQFLLGMEQRNIRKVLFLGDSVTRFMGFDMKDFLGGITQDWLKKNPLHYYNIKNETSNWDYYICDWILLGNSSARKLVDFIVGYCNNLYDIELEGGYTPSCCQTNTCSNFSLDLRFREFIPGNDKNFSRDWWQWERVIDDSMGAHYTPDVLVFNAGIWILYFFPYDQQIQQMQQIAKAIAEVCQKRRITLIWRSTTFGHNIIANHRIKDMNKEAIRIISEYPNTYIFDSPYVMTALRPDTASDGFHYSYRKPHKAWRLCDLPADSFRMNCVRHPDFPLSSSRGMALMLANMLIHSGNILFNSSAAKLYH